MNLKDADDALSLSDTSFEGCSALICNGNLGSPDALLANYYPWWPRGHRQSLLSCILTKSLFYKHKLFKDRYNFRFVDCIYYGCKNPQSLIGAIAGSKYSYSAFREIFNLLI